MAQAPASRCFDPCTMWYTRADASSACNCTQHTPKGIKQVCFHKVETEMQMRVEKSIMASSRELRWEGAPRADYRERHLRLRVLELRKSTTSLSCPRAL